MSRLSRLDFPTFERPRKATSGGPEAGWSPGLVALLTNSAVLTFNDAARSVGHRPVIVPAVGDHLALRGISEPLGQPLERDGEDHVPWFADADRFLAELQEFLTGERAAAVVDRVLATVLFTDIIGSTERAAELGDRGCNGSNLRQSEKRHRI